MELRKAYQAMFKAMPGGMAAMAGAMGKTAAWIHNRVYEVKGQTMEVDTALTMQSLAGTTHFAEAIAQVSGGVFMKLPDVSEVDRDDLLKKFNELQSRLGELSRKFSDATDDNEIDKHERASLEETEAQIHKTLGELTALSFAIYCKPESKLQRVK